jgi:pantoate--beta-alanine ligase
MHVWNTVAAWRDRRRSLECQSVGFVPTMGGLHRGHESLVERCRTENGIAVVSIFVNPTQFNDPQDLSRYPRTLDRDLATLASLGVDDVLVPDAADLYPNDYRFHVEPGGGDSVLEGACRPGFLPGMLTIVLKLLNLVHADNAYFGEKDYQQLQLVTEMAAEFFIPTKIVACPTVREEAGLAMSTRNQLLSTQGRDRSPHLFQILQSTSDPAEARTALEAAGFTVDYVEERWGRRLAAVFLDGVRLIDNVPIASREGAA